MIVSIYHDILLGNKTVLQTTLATKTVTGIWFTSTMPNTQNADPNTSHRKPQNLQGLKIKTAFLFVPKLVFSLVDFILI